MKNLLIYINPRRDFGIEEEKTAKIQIDNSIELGWKRKDIILATNFPYEYRRIESIIVGGENYCGFQPTMSKINTIIDLYDRKLIEKDEIYWYHDFDVFQNEVIKEKEIEDELAGADLGLTDKGRMPRWNCGCLFFRKNLEDIFRKIKKLAYRFKTWDEPALMALTTNNLLWASQPEPEATIGDNVLPVDISGTESIKDRVRKINITYNFRMWNIRSTYPMATKPIRAVHFHPFYKMLYNGPIDEVAFFMYGKNKINTVLVPKRLIKIFNKYGIK